MITIPMIKVINIDNLIKQYFYSICIIKFKSMENISLTTIVVYLVLSLIYSWAFSSFILFLIYKARGIKKSFIESTKDMQMAVLWTFFIPFIPNLTAFIIGFTTEKK